MILRVIFILSIRWLNHLHSSALEFSNTSGVWFLDVEIRCSSLELWIDLFMISIFLIFSFDSSRSHIWVITHVYDIVTTFIVLNFINAFVIILIIASFVVTTFVVPYFITLFIWHVTYISWKIILILIKLLLVCLVRFCPFMIIIHFRIVSRLHNFITGQLWSINWSSRWWVTWLINELKLIGRIIHSWSIRIVQIELFWFHVVIARRSMEVHLTVRV